MESKALFQLACRNGSMGRHKKLSTMHIHLIIKYHDYREFTGSPCCPFRTLQASSHDFCGRDKVHWQDCRPFDFNRWTVK